MFMVNIIRSKVVDSTNDLKEQKPWLWSILRVYDDHCWKITSFNVVKENDKICHHRPTLTETSMVLLVQTSSSSNFIGG